ncbi:MAG: glucosidase, partial [Acidobacteriaceae bacterium]|nr:glucosidase [Acidobacteriaceae bacterium]
YYYLAATPTSSYLKGLYKYPQAEFPYARLVEESRRRTRLDPEFEIEDTGIFAENRYFDVFAEYAKRDVDDILIRITLVNRGPESAEITCLPTLWFRNTWTWGGTEEPASKPNLTRSNSGNLEVIHPILGRFFFTLDGCPELLFTDNETNAERIWGAPGKNRYSKDAFHEYLIKGRGDAININLSGTKACAVYRYHLEAGAEVVLQFRLARDNSPQLPRSEWESVFQARIAEAKRFYSGMAPWLDADAQAVIHQAYAGLFWSRQFYHYVVETWLDGDPGMPTPPASRLTGRNHRWRHLFNEDVISMPDKWEYPWYAAWDLGFHAVAIAPADPDSAKAQLALFLREWYMHPNGQLPAYEWALSDANPPVHAWAAWRVFKIDARVNKKHDFPFLERVFHKLLMNFTWWVNRKDSEGANVFEGGFLGLDNIGLFDRSADLPAGWLLEQSDGSSWMAMYCLTMLKMALQLAVVDDTYEDIASKFFEHFLYIADAINHHEGGLWDQEDGFYYDRLRMPDGSRQLLRLRTIVGLIPLIACDTLEASTLERFPGFRKRLEWFVQNRPDLTEGLASMTETGENERRLLSVANRTRLERILARLFDESEFLSPYGLRSLSRFHKDHPYSIQLDGHSFRVDYDPAESTSGLFGGNSNWRGPVWFPMNFLQLEALQRLGHYFGDSLLVEFPTGSGNKINLTEAARELSRRLTELFLRDDKGHRPVYGKNQLFQCDPHFRDYILFYEYFHGDTGVGLGASHQTGWTGIVAKLLTQCGCRVRTVSAPVHEEATI